MRIEKEKTMKKIGIIGAMELEVATLKNLPPGRRRPAAPAPYRLRPCPGHCAGAERGSHTPGI